MDYVYFYCWFCIDRNIYNCWDYFYCVFSSITAQMPGPAIGGSPLSIIPLFFVLLLYFFPAYYLFKFSRYSKNAIRYKSNSDLNLALKYLKYYYRFLGILLIVVISFYAFFFIFMLVFGGIMNNW